MKMRQQGDNALIFIFILVLINMIGFGVIMPVMPQLIMDISGGDLAAAARWGGILSLLYAVMQFISMPVMGGLSDRFGRRPVLLISLAAFAIDYLLMAIAPTMALLIVARLLSGTFAATFSTANAYIADITPPEKRAASFGLMGAAFGVGFIIGPGLGGLLGDHFGPRAPFYTVAMLGALNFLYGLLVMPESLALENRRPFEWKRANALGNFRQFQRYPMMLPIAAAILLVGLAHWSLPSVWAYYAPERFGWSAADVGWSLMFVGLTSGIMQGAVIRIVIPKFGERLSAYFSIIIIGVSYLGYALVPSGAGIYVMVAFASLGAFAQPALQGIMSRTIPANAQGELQGALALLQSLSMIISPPIMTLLFSYFAKPGEPFELFGVVLSKTGAPFYFPGAPFVLSCILAICALIPLTAATKRIVRAREDKPPTS